MQIAQKNFYKKLLGKAGEKTAEKYLSKNGYTVLETNYRTHLGEIDIIAKEKETLVFVEVKTRSSEDFGAPSEAVDKRKREKYQRVATEYLVKTNNQNAVCRFDVVEIEDGKINIIKDAFCC